MSAVVWGDPPPAGPRYRYEPFLAALQERPGEWGAPTDVDRDPNRSGVYALAKRWESRGFETRISTVDGVKRIWARWPMGGAA